MTFRRRLALWLDPALKSEQPIRLDLYASHTLSSELGSISRTLQRIERLMAGQKRRPRIINCEHPELHPEIEVTVGPC